MGDEVAFSLLQRKRIWKPGDGIFVKVSFKKKKEELMI